MPAIQKVCAEAGMPIDRGMGTAGALAFFLVAFWRCGLMEGKQREV